MTNYRYLGYGVTNSEGIAKLDHNAQGQEISHSYTGVGAGEIDVLASLDNPIAEGSIVSEPCEVLDCLVHGVTIADWNVPSQFSYSDGVFTCTSSSSGTFETYLNTNISGDFKIEITGLFASTDWTGRIRLYSVSDNKDIIYTLYNNVDDTLIIQRVNGVFSATMNGNNKNPVTANEFTGDVKLYLRFYLANANITKEIGFDDIKIYPI